MAIDTEAQSYIKFEEIESRLVNELELHVICVSFRGISVQWLLCGDLGKYMCLRVTLVIVFLLYSGHSMWPDPLPG